MQIAVQRYCLFFILQIFSQKKCFLLSFLLKACIRDNADAKDDTELFFDISIELAFPKWGYK